MRNTLNCPTTVSASRCSSSLDDKCDVHEEHEGTESRRGEMELKFPMSNICVLIINCRMDSDSIGDPKLVCCVAET